MKVAGIDYSITSPAICVHHGKKWHYTNCHFFYIDSNTNRQKIPTPERYHRITYPAYSHDLERFELLALWAVKSLKGATSIGLEGYSMGSKGKVFNLAENTCLLKYHLWKNGKSVNIYAPTTLKKFATGKGNANKELMESKFQEETGCIIKEHLNIKTKSGPHYDIVDAYWICKYNFLNLNNGE